MDRAFDVITAKNISKDNSFQMVNKSLSTPVNYVFLHAALQLFAVLIISIFLFYALLLFSKYLFTDR